MEEVSFLQLSSLLRYGADCSPTNHHTRGCLILVYPARTLFCPMTFTHSIHTWKRGIAKVRFNQNLSGQSDSAFEIIVSNSCVWIKWVKLVGWKRGPAYWTTWCKRSKPSHTKITCTIWPRELSSAIFLAKSLSRVEYELAKCPPGPLFSCFWPASGPLTAQRVSVGVGVADSLQFMAGCARNAR